MLEELHIQNFALIDDITVCFQPGFNVLSGETGAGKSILIDALSLALGAKGQAQSVREGTEEAVITATFSVSDGTELSEWTGKYSIEPEDGQMIVRRTLRASGRGTVSIQAVSVPRSALTELASALVDIHGQHEHQSLFNTASHRKLLDRFAGISERVDVFSGDFTSLSETTKRLEELKAADTSRESELLQYAVDEIGAANLRPEEEDELLEKRKVLSRSEELADALEQVIDACSGSHDGALSRLRGARDDLEKAFGIDSSLGEILQRFDSAFYELEDMLDDLRRRCEDTDFNPAVLEQTDNRLSLISSLEQKYGTDSVSGLFEWAAQSQAQLEQFKTQKDEIRELTERHQKLQNSLVSEAAQITRIRRGAASSLQDQAEKHLRLLGMQDARFRVDLQVRQSRSGSSLIGPRGADSVEFLLSANRGEPPKTLKSVASGGELSRVMLALKTVLSESDSVQTMIFDEVDTGIGGEVARSVGEHLLTLSQNKQVFCITHLASIAVLADNHLQVGKVNVNGRTVTRVQRTEGEQRIQEVARMLAGDREDSASLEHAARLLKESPAYRSV